MSLFSLMGSLSSFNSALSAPTSEIDESSNTEKELTKKITEAEIEIENFSFEPDEDFSNNTTNKTKD